MASSSRGKAVYPPRLFPPGKSPVQKRSLNNYCHLTDFGMMLEAVGDEVYDELMHGSQVGVILKLAKKPYVWAAKTVHNFVTNQLYVERSYEIWSLIGGRPIRFSLHEFSDITGLNCQPLVDDGWDIDHNEFWAEIGVNPKVGPNWHELVKVFETCKTWTFEKKKMVALLFVLHIGIFGINRNSRIPLECAKRVLDEAAFESYPWGRVGFKELITSIKIASLGKFSYTFHGCVHALLIWAYESVPILGKKFGNRLDNARIFPSPLLRWRSTRERYNLDKVLEEEISTTPDKKVRVRHLLEVPREEIYPIWPDEPSTADVDPKLHNMITDILDGCLDETAWEVGEDSKGKKTPKKDKKYKKESKGREEKKEKKETTEKKGKKEKEKLDSEDDFVEDPTKKKRKVKVGPGSSTEKKKEKKMKEKEVECTEDVSDTEMEIPVMAFMKKVQKMKPREEENSAVLQAIKLLASKIDAIDERVNIIVAKETVEVQGGAESNADGAAVKKDRVRKSLF